MSSKFKVQGSKWPHRGGLCRRPAAVAAILVFVILIVGAASAVFAWSDRTHFTITEEAVRRLPEPLRGLFSDGAALARLKEASAAPDARREAVRKQISTSPAEEQETLRRQYVEEKARHYFDIDAVRAEPPPFAAFPRDRKAAEKEFGVKVFQEHGTALWAAEDAFSALVDALSRGAAADIFRAAGDLAHYAADLHTPMHVSKNFNGQLTGNEGIHKALEIGLVVRHEEFYAAEVRKGRTEVACVENVRDALFDALVQANARMAPIVEAETAARRKTGYNPGDKNNKEAEREMEDPANEKARPYYAAFKQELEARGSPEAAAMRDAAAHLARLYYTAWVRAGKPTSLFAAAPAPEAAPMSPYVLLMPAALLALLLLWPRRKPSS
jgi:hypothetical protein